MSLLDDEINPQAVAAQVPLWGRRRRPVSEASRARAPWARTVPSMVEVRRATSDDVDGCVAVLEALPDYFTPDTHDDLRERFPRCTTYVAVDEGEVVGCVLLQPQVRER